MAYRKDARASQRKRRLKRMRAQQQKNRCRFTRAKVESIDYKDTETLGKLLTNQGRMFNRKRSGNTAYWQRQVKIAIKRARFMGLLAYTA